MAACGVIQSAYGTATRCLDRVMESKTKLDKGEPGPEIRAKKKMLDTREGTREKAQMAGNFVKRKYGRRFLLKRFGRTIDLLSFVILCDNFFSPSFWR